MSDLIRELSRLLDLACEGMKFSFIKIIELLVAKLVPSPFESTELPKRSLKPRLLYVFSCLSEGHDFSVYYQLFIP